MACRSTYNFDARQHSPTATSAFPAKSRRFDPGLPLQLAETFPLTFLVHASFPSHALRLNRDRDPFGQGVEHRRERWPELGEFLQFLVAQIRADIEAHADVLKSVAHALVGPQEPPLVDVAFDLRLHLFDHDPSGSSVIDQG